MAVFLPSWFPDCNDNNDNSNNNDNNDDDDDDDDNDGDDDNNDDDDDDDDNNDNGNNNNNRIQWHSLSFFLNSLLIVLRTICNMYAQVARVQSCANYVQHIERISHASCRVTCHGV